MFKKWTQPEEEKTLNKRDETTPEPAMKPALPARPVHNVSHQNNTLLKGSKLIGDIIVTCDLELSGEIQGNITSEKNSNIVIGGICRGNIDTKEGSVEIDGELQGGNINAGNNVVVAGKFSGGEIKARGKIQINGEFDGRLEADEIEIGPDSRGKGELVYRESISIAKGARIEAKVSQGQKELKLVKPEQEKKPKEMKPKPVVQEINEISTVK
jgi:cytoskeletal protein CcmA (bactofilin family)